MIYCNFFCKLHYKCIVMRKVVDKIKTGYRTFCIYKVQQFPVKWKPVSFEFPSETARKN